MLETFSLPTIAYLIKGIETTERDEIYEALRLILRDLPPGNYLNIDELLEEFEHVRDF